MSRSLQLCHNFQWELVRTQVTWESSYQCHGLVFPFSFSGSTLHQPRGRWILDPPWWLLRKKWQQQGSQRSGLEPKGEGRQASPFLFCTLGLFPGELTPISTTPSICYSPCLTKNMLKRNPGKLHSFRQTLKFQRSEALISEEQEVGSCHFHALLRVLWTLVDWGF